MSGRLPTIDQLKEYLCEEYDCRWEAFSRQHDGKTLHGGIFRRGEGPDEVDAPYLTDEIGAKVSGHVIRRICKDLGIPPAEVFDWFERQSLN